MRHKVLILKVKSPPEKGGVRVYIEWKALRCAEYGCGANQRGS